tara:strand:- start:269 stop:484 length:216 start_codon:yes stop_codon:yes gene_type:complete
LFGEIAKNLRGIMKTFLQFQEQAMAAPTNNVGSGNIAGTVEAGDDPPVKKRKKYIYQKGVRKIWKPDGRRS